MGRPLTTQYYTSISIELVWGNPHLSDLWHRSLFCNDMKIVMGQ